MNGEPTRPDPPNAPLQTTSVPTCGQGSVTGRTLGTTPSPAGPPVGEVPPAVLKAERESLKARRENAGFARTGNPAEDAVGLALSGGGIRSACFGLGLLQALYSRGVLPFVDYLSTVSGGGYIGAWLSAQAHHDGAKDRPFHGRDDSPFHVADRRPLPQQTQRFLLTGDYLRPSLAAASRYLIGLLANGLAYVFFFLAVCAALAFVWRIFDYPFFVSSLRRGLYLLQTYLPVQGLFRTDGLLWLCGDRYRQLFPAFVWFVLWVFCWLVAVRARSTNWATAAKFCLFFCLASLLIGLAVLLGNGDVDADDLFLSWLVGDLPSYTLPAGLTLVLAALIPFLNPWRLVQSGLRPQAPLQDRVIFSVASGALLLGVPFLGVYFLGQENLSGVGTASVSRIEDWAELRKLTTPGPDQQDPFDAALVNKTVHAYEHSRLWDPWGEGRQACDLFLKDPSHNEGAWDRLEHDRGSPEVDAWQEWLTKLLNRGLADRDLASTDLPSEDAFRARLDAYWKDRIAKQQNDPDRQKEIRADSPAITDRLLAIRAKVALLNKDQLQGTLTDEEVAEFNRARLALGHPELAAIPTRPTTVKRVVVVEADQWERARWGLLCLLAALAAAVLVPLNRTGLHPYYRDRLACQYAGRCPTLPLDQLDTTRTGAPYHLFSCAVYLFPSFKGSLLKACWKYFRDWKWWLLLLLWLAGAALCGVVLLVLLDPVHHRPLAPWPALEKAVGVAAALLLALVAYLGFCALARPRKGVENPCPGNPGGASLSPLTTHFLLSPGHSGSSVLGYRDTGGLKIDGKRMTLADATALSAGAFAPHQVTNPLLWVIMTLTNLRLGQWIPNPRESNGGGWRQGKMTLLKLLPGLFEDPVNEQPHCFVSDGGHFDNLGLWPLLQRRCRLIIAADLSDDKEYACEAMHKLTWLARAHLGITFSPPLHGQGAGANGQGSVLDFLALRPGAPKAGDNGKRRFSKSPFVVAQIHYPGSAEPRTGMLIYLKPSLIGDEPADLRGYWETHPDFPHDPTSRQLYDPAQVEAYRQLGFHIGEKLSREFSGQQELAALLNSAEDLRPAPPRASAAPRKRPRRAKRK